MNKTIHRIANAVLTCVMILGSYVNAQAASGQTSLEITSATYYVSPTGNDSNTGTLLAPFKTFKKATSMLTAGSTLYILPGIYNEALRIINSGTDGAWITVRPSGGNVIIDLKKSSNPAVFLQGSFIALGNLEVKGSNDICVLSSGNYVRISGLVVHECQTHGIFVSGQHAEVTGNLVYATSLENQTRIASNNWGSGIKVELGGNDVLVEGNTAFNNYGEGIASTGGSNVIVRGNTVFDNFSVNIYVDNSFDVLVEKNFVSCHANSGFERDGSPASGIALGEEYYSGWGAQLNRVTIRNNIVAFCKSGFYYFGTDSGLTNGGLKSSTIVYNTFWGSTDAAIGVTYETGQTNSLIANNIIWQANNKLAYIENSTGLTFKNNLWKVAPPTSAKGIGDRIGDPIFAATPGYTAQTFMLSNLSPAIGGAMNVGVTTDYFGNQRGPSYEMGALQFLGAIPSPTQITAVASPTFTATTIPSTPVPTNTPPSSGAFVSTELTPTSLTVGEAALVSVRLNNVPVEGYKSAEFTCTYNANFVQISNIVPANLFGADAAVAIYDPQNGSSIFAIAGTNGNKATTSGPVFTFNAKGLQAGQSVVECKARVSKGDNVPIDLPFTGAGLTILGVGPTPTTIIPFGSPTPTIIIPFASPTPIFTFTPLPSPNGSLTGKVIASKPVSVSLVDANNAIVTSAVASPDGIFNLTALAGNYKVVAVASGFLGHQGSASLIAGNTITKPTISLLAGDIDGNNVIDQFDALTIGMSYNTSTPAAADLNNDGMINFLDLELLAGNYRKTGPTVWE